MVDSSVLLPTNRTMLDEFLSEIMELNVEMACLDLTEMQSDDAIAANELDEAEISFVENSDITREVTAEACDADTKLRRSLRKRVHPAENNRRVITKPRKISVDSDSQNVKKYYLCKTVKRLPSTLETIFEEPKMANNDFQYMSTRKFKRVLSFEDESDMQRQKRTKKRLMKAKKITSVNRKSRRKKVSMDLLLDKLASLDAPDVQN